MCIFDGTSPKSAYVNNIIVIRNGFDRKLLCLSYKTDETSWLNFLFTLLLYGSFPIKEIVSFLFIGWTKYRLVLAHEFKPSSGLLDNTIITPRYAFWRP